jgi:hypothetical protein
MLLSKGKQFVREADNFKILALEGEEVLASIQIGLGAYLLTNIRLVGISPGGGVKTSHPLSEIKSFRVADGKLGKIFFITTDSEGETKVGGLLADTAEKFPELFSIALQKAEASPELRVESIAAASGRYANVPTNRAKANLPTHLVKVIEKNAKTGEDPLMIITGQYDSTDGSLIVFKDRCVISKSGIIGGFMSGSLGGSRDATFYFRDITGIEYNSGMLTGVLEILTASYQGSENKDYWTGFLKADKNKSGNDPRAMSNTLPLIKSDYLSAKPLIDQLRTMIQDSKETKIVVNNTSPAVSAADELGKLAELMDKGLITLEEFQAAKKRLLS